MTANDSQGSISQTVWRLSWLATARCRLPPANGFLNRLRPLGLARVYLCLWRWSDVSAPQLEVGDACDKYPLSRARPRAVALDTWSVIDSLPSRPREHFLGKEKVPGSNPGVGSASSRRLDFVFISRLLEGDGRLTGNDREMDWNLP